MDLAVVSGAAAAQTILDAHQKGDFSAAALASYEARLKASTAYRDMQTFQNVYPMMDNPRLFEFYPDLVCELMEDMFAVKTTPAKKAWPAIKEHTQGQISLLDLTRDMWAISRGLVL
jgi:electron transfer flavoprotein-quinone oxidoreductase